MIYEYYDLIQNFIPQAMVPRSLSCHPLLLMSCQQTLVTQLLASRSKSGYESLSSILGSGVHDFQRLTGLGGQGAELGILRQRILRGWGGKMRPAGSDGETVLSSGPGFARPRLSALIPLAPDHVTVVAIEKSIMVRLGDYP